MKTSRTLTGGDAVVGALEGLGIPLVFGVASVHNLPIFDALTRSPIRLVPTRTEAGALNMADAYARVSGGIGVAITSTGTGAGNAAGAMIEAFTAGSRVLHITAQIDSAFLGRGTGYIHETKDQLGMLAAISKRALQAERGRVGEAIAEAVGILVEFPQGPVSVEIPIDVQYGRSGFVGASLAEPLRPQPDAHAVRAAVDALESARRPAIWAGGGVNASGAGPELLAVLEGSSAALFTSNKGRGAVSEEHPQCVGNFASHATGAAFLGDCDLLLSIGTHFRSNETNTYGLQLPELHIQIDVDPAAIGRSFAASLGVVGDAKVTLGLIAQMLDHSAPFADYRAEVVAVKARVREAVRSTLGPYAKLADALAAHVRSPTVLARDVTVLSNLIANRLHNVQEAEANVYAVGGGVGQGLAMGIGAALARPAANVLVLAGDGGFACSLGEMATATQEGLRLGVLLFDDGGYGVLRNTQDAAFGGRRIGVDLTSPDFELLAEAMGWGGGSVRDADEFEPALAKLMRSSRQELVVADLASIGDLTEPFLPPVKIGR